MKKTALISLTIMLILVLPQTGVFASSNKTERQNEDKTKVEKELKNESEEKTDNEENDAEENKVYIEKGDKYSYMLKTSESNFMIKGIISSFDISSLVIFDKTVKIDKSVAPDYKEVGKPEKGMFAIVQGIIKDNTYYATRLVVTERNKLEVYPKPTATEGARMEKKYKEATKSSELKNLKKEYKGEIKQVKSIDEFITFLEELLNKLKELKK